MSDGSGVTQLTALLQSILAPIDGMTIIDNQGRVTASKIFTVFAPDTTKPPYIVLTPVDDGYNEFADDEPQGWIEEVLISLYTDVSYQALAEAVCSACIAAGCTITERGFVEREEKTGYYHYAITVDKNF